MGVEKSDIQTEDLAANSVQVGQLDQNIVRDLSAMLPHRFEDLGTQFVLHLGTLGEQVERACECIRGCVHAREYKGAARIFVSRRMEWKWDIPTYAMWPRSSSSVN